ncbi:MAG: hypothetical protein QOD77_879 [Thermoplasmata archaeon]|jgi:hypothetical protein|nr:hypothetical protein [Thermoplasmata archaeon]
MSPLQAFFEQVPALYRAAQAPVHDSYQRLLYTIEHPLAEPVTDAIEQAFGLPRPKWAGHLRRDAIALLDAHHYPATAPISDLPAVSGLDLRTLSHYLHFFHHAYPIYDEASCKGLARLGFEVPFVRERDADVYGAYIQAIETLKERIPFWDVPETNVYLTRIVQGALQQFGATTNQR